MTRAVVVALTLLAAPRPALACATCIGSAFGDRGFNWAFVVMMVAPLAVAAAVVGILVYVFGSHPTPIHPTTPTESRSC